MGNVFAVLPIVVFFVTWLTRIKQTTFVQVMKTASMEIATCKKVSVPVRIQLALGHFVSTSTIVLGVVAQTMEYAMKLLGFVVAQNHFLALTVHWSQSVLMMTPTVRQCMDLEVNVTLDQNPVGVDGQIFMLESHAPPTVKLMEGARMVGFATHMEM